MENPFQESSMYVLYIILFNRQYHKISLDGLSKSLIEESSLNDEFRFKKQNSLSDY